MQKEFQVHMALIQEKTAPIKYGNNEYTMVHELQFSWHRKKLDFTDIIYYEINFYCLHNKNTLSPQNIIFKHWSGVMW